MLYSAGVGRTGTFVALDVLIQQLQHEDFVDVFAVVYQMRMSRVLMVQTEVALVYTFINVKKTFQFRTQCKGVKSHIQNCTNHFGEDT